MPPRFTHTHGYTAICVAGIGMLVQLGISEFMTTSSSNRIAHEAKQFLAVIPKLISDFASLVLLGPSPRAVASRSFFVSAIIAIVLVHGAKTHATTLRHAASPSHESLISMLQAGSCFMIHLIMFFLHQPCGFGAWLCYRGAHVAVGVSSIALCLYLRLQTQSSTTNYPPLRGSFEGAILMYTTFIMLSLWWTPARRFWVHSTLCNMIPWMPLSALKDDDLKKLLEPEHTPVAAQPAVDSANIQRRRLQEGHRPPSLPSLSEGGKSADQCGQRLGSSTLGSDSEIAELSRLQPPSPLHSARGATANESFGADLHGDFAPAFYLRQRALERTLKDLGITFPAEEAQQHDPENEDRSYGSPSGSPVSSSFGSSE